MGLFQSQAAVVGVQGAAGTAKTSTVLKTYAQAMRDQGITVREASNTETVEIVNEASLTSAPDMERLLARASAQANRLVLVGVSKQLGSVGGGRAFAQLQQHGMETHRLDEIVRQTNPHMLAAVNALLAGDAAEAFFRLDVGGGAIVEHPEADIRHAKMAGDFVKLTP